MPASDCFPGQPGVDLEFFTLTTRFAFGKGCDRSSYVNLKLATGLNFVNKAISQTMQFNAPPASIDMPADQSGPSSTDSGSGDF